jgi:hypothetical protein
MPFANTVKAFCAASAVVLLSFVTHVCPSTTHLHRIAAHLHCSFMQLHQPLGALQYAAAAAAVEPLAAKPSYRAALALVALGDHSLGKVICLRSMHARVFVGVFVCMCMGVFHMRVCV